MYSHLNLSFVYFVWFLSFLEKMGAWNSYHFLRYTNSFICHSNYKLKFNTTQQTYNLNIYLMFGPIHYIYNTLIMRWHAVIALIKRILLNGASYLEVNYFRVEEFFVIRKINWLKFYKLVEKNYQKEAINFYFKSIEQMAAFS